MPVQTSRRRIRRYQGMQTMMIFQALNSTQSLLPAIVISLGCTQRRTKSLGSGNSTAPHGSKTPGTGPCKTPRWPALLSESCCSAGVFPQMFVLRCLNVHVQFSHGNFFMCKSQLIVKTSRNDQHVCKCVARHIHLDVYCHFNLVWAWARQEQVILCLCMQGSWGLICVVTLQRAHSRSAANLVVTSLPPRRHADARHLHRRQAMKAPAQEASRPSGDKPPFRTF